MDERLNLPSASSMARTHKCAGWLNLWNSIPVDQRPREDSAVAEAGTRMHAALEQEDTSDLDLTEAEIVDRIKELESKAVEDWKRDFNIKEAGAIREERCWFRDDEMKPLASAKVDVAYIGGESGEYALCIDAKTGFLPAVPASRNQQLKLQALALQSEYGVKQVRVAIAQHRFVSYSTAADFMPEDLERAGAEVRFDLWRATQSDAARVPSEECRYCPCKTHCRENAAYTLLPSVALAPTLPANPKKQDIITAVAQLSIDDLAVIQRRGTLISTTLEAVKARLKSLPKEELARVGFELTEGRNQQAMTSFNGLTEFLYGAVDDGTITNEEFATMFDFRSGQCEKLLLPRILAKAESEGRKLTAKEVKENLRAALGQFINFAASKTEPVLKELK